MRNPGCFPSRFGNLLKHCVEIVDNQRDVNMTDVAGSMMDILFSTRRREILKQFDLVTVRRLYDGEFDLGARNPSDFLRRFASLMRRMGKLEAEHIPPERESALEIGDRDAGVIRRNDAKGFRAHDFSTADYADFADSKPDIKRLMIEAIRLCEASAG